MSTLPWKIASFSKKTRRGKVLRVVREHYLRDDIYVPTELLDEDGEPVGSMTGRSSVDGVLLSSQPFRKTYLVLDTNVVLNQMDLLDHHCSATSNIIILQTVWQEVKHRNLGTYNRLRAVMKSEKRRFVPFSNEHHRETYVDREAGESPNDRNDRAIRVFSAWYQKQLALTNVKVLMLTNDRENLNKAKQAGVNAMTIHQYVRGVADKFPDLTDKLAQCIEAQAQGEAPAKGAIFAEHWPLSRLTAAIKAGKAFQGVIRCSRNHWAEMYVNCHGGTAGAGVGAKGGQVSVLISGREAINRSIDGDVVVIEILPQEQWSTPSDAMKGRGEADEAGAKGGKGAEPTGRVVGVIQRNWRHYCGSIEPEEGNDVVTERVLVSPVDKKVPRILIRTRQREELLDKRILVAIDDWPATSAQPLGHYVRTMGTIGDKAVETEVLLLEWDIPSSVFSAKVMACLPPTDWAITPKNSKGRVDLRGKHAVLSIDPPGCKDIDDALHCSVLPNGNYSVGVHIADVTHFCQAGCAMDVEAGKRGTSTYLVDRRLDMLPGLLTETLCSLKGNVDRFAFSVMWEMTPEAKIVKVDFHKSIIHSVGAYAYAEAQLMLDDLSINTTAASSVRRLHSLSKILRKKRLEAGALTLASPEVRFKLDTESHDPTDVQVYALRDSNALVEEFMLLANITVGKKVLRHFPMCSMLRRHPSPARSQFDALLKSAKSVGFDLCVDSSKALADSLDKAVAPSNPYMNKLLRIMATRCMKPAQYFCSGEFTVASGDYHHYGLAAPIYTHFTSPIRRYADVVVHRLLAAAIGIAPLPSSFSSKADMHEVAQQLNKRHHAAQQAGRASVALYTHIYFKERPTEERAVVMRLRSNGLVVLVPRFGLESPVFLVPKGKSKADQPEPADWVTYDADAETIVHVQQPLITLKVFDEVRVRITVRTDGSHGRQTLVMDLLEPFAFDADPESKVLGSESSSGSSDSKSKGPKVKAAKGKASPAKVTEMEEESMEEESTAGAAAGGGKGAATKKKRKRTEGTSSSESPQAATPGSGQKARGKKRSAAESAEKEGATKAKAKGGKAKAKSKKIKVRVKR
jgi:exosome complex exonuclease DIS3/RRP44